jgi:lactate dehydrogenase-like 2-hydroxyacid dehydrogenase
MNTPSFNSRATAQMAMKALLRVAPDLPVDILHEKVVARQFDTGRNLKDFPTEKLEGKKIALIGYGNIGREVAKLAHAFGMRVAIHARPRHREWIECEGFEYAATPEDAARNADFISPHTGLGAFNSVTGKYANAGVVDARVLNAMKDGAVLINYDRGEVVDAAALDAALSTGKIRYACIDADLFVDAATGKCTGPMVPYLDLDAKHKGKLQLLPHAAADTEHCSRVEGARQAVDQIFDAIQYRSVTNLKGDLPRGYVDAGARTVNGIGKVTRLHLDRVVRSPAQIAAARELSEHMAAIWGALATASSGESRHTLIERHGPQLVKSINRYRRLMEELGIEGPFG